MKFIKLNSLPFLLVSLLILAIVLHAQNKKADSSTLSATTEEILNEIGEFKIGDPAPFKPGEEIRRSYRRIPPSKFYVYVWSPNIEYGCVYEECGKNGEIVASMRGWLSGTGTSYEELVPLVNSSKVKSLVIVADRNSKVVGVYPNRDMSDMPDILTKHKDLADFNMLEGVVELGDLKLNSELPFDPAEYVMDQFKEEIKKPNYYLIVVHETISNEQYCPYLECGVFLETIFTQNGWFLDFNHKNSEIIEKLGLSASQVARGEVTLVVLADRNQKIVSIHPNKDMRDMHTVLTQHPDLIHFRDFPWR